MEKTEKRREERRLGGVKKEGNAVGRWGASEVVGRWARTRGTSFTEGRAEWGGKEGRMQAPVAVEGVGGRRWFGARRGPMARNQGHGPVASGGPGLA